MQLACRHGDVHILVDADWQRLAQARIAARRDTEGLQYLINTVPASLKGDPGLAFERYLYRVTKRRWQDAEDFILEASRSADALGRPDMWMERRANLARQALEDGDPAAVREELGDVLFQVLFHARIAADHDDRELVAAEAADQGGLRQRSLDARADGRKQRVAGVVAVHVVHFLEAVEIDECECHRSSPARDCSARSR